MYEFMSLRLVDTDIVQALGGYCLDGSRPGYWYEPPSQAPGVSRVGNRSWFIFLDGGAWCYDEHDCESRSKTFKGSSRKFPARYWPYSGPLDSNPKVNPSFAGFHRVLIGYCDGSSYTGDRLEPYKASTGSMLWFRGRAALEAQLLDLQRAGLSDAENVLFSGGSAGGLGAIFASNRLQAQLPNVAVYKVLLVSSFFMLLPGQRAAGAAPTCAHGRGSSTKCIPWALKMRAMCQLHNCTRTLRTAGDGCGVPERASDKQGGVRWSCLFPVRSLRSVRAPTFVINSAVDSWQLVNVWRRYYRCRYDGTTGCTRSQEAHAVEQTNGMIDRFVGDLRISGMLTTPGHGAFVTSCNEHVAGISADGFRHYRIGNCTMRKALDRWWAAPLNSAAAEHIWLPCHLFDKSVKDSPHHQCNPSCLKLRLKRRLTQECPCDPGK